MSHTIQSYPGPLTLSPPAVSDLVLFASGQGHPDYPCLSRTHAPASCVPCADFSPWLRQRVRHGDVESVAEYLFRVREANPGVGESREESRERFGRLAEALLAAPLDLHLRDADGEASLDLRVTLILLAVHEGFSGFVMTGEAADFLACVMAPHALRLSDESTLVDDRNRFVRAMSSEVSYWAGWPILEPGSLADPTPPADPALDRLRQALGTLPLGPRVHAVDVVRHLSAHPHVPKTLANLSRYETRKRGLDVVDSCRRILASELVVAATDLDGWLGSWTRRDLLAFLAQSGVPVRSSWTKERLAEVATAEREELLRRRMAEAGVVELAVEYEAGARLLRDYLQRVRETWRTWLGFGTGVEPAR
jgi:hypothetical protein